MKTVSLVIAVLLSVNAPAATILWDLNTEPDISGYNILIGSGTSKVTNFVAHPGNQLTLNTPFGAPYTISATALNKSGLESDPCPVVLYTNLMVSLPPVFSTDPASQIVSKGASVSFTMGVNGTPPITFQWYKDNIEIPGATNGFLTLSSVKRDANGNYMVRASNAAGSAFSRPALLLVKPGQPQHLRTE